MNEQKGKFQISGNLVKSGAVAFALMAIAFVFLFLAFNPLRMAEASEHLNSLEAEKSKAAFKEASAVFFSARCSNCHPAGDAPLQGDERRVHDQGVTRGPEGKGPAGMSCSTCHQEENIDGEGLPPGAPNWHMPPEAQKMVFEGLTAAMLCEQLKDPLRNGGRKSVQDAIAHVETDPLVGWAWAPGSGRSVPPMTREDFVKKLKEWADNGAVCPE